LVSGFALTAVITLAISAVGYWQVDRLSSAIYEVGVVRLPSIEALEQGSLTAKTLASLMSVKRPGSSACRTAILAKPFRLAELASSVRRLLDLPLSLPVEVARQED
jgi:hypothetical protein